MVTQRQSVTMPPPYTSFQLRQSASEVCRRSRGIDKDPRPRAGGRRSKDRLRADSSHPRGTRALLESGRGLLACDSSYSARPSRLPGGANSGHRRQPETYGAGLRFRGLSSSLTAAGPRRILTAFPIPGSVFNCRHLLYHRFSRSQVWRYGLLTPVIVKFIAAKVVILSEAKNLAVSGLKARPACRNPCPLASPADLRAKNAVPEV
jgi:hypothetical protein